MVAVTYTLNAGYGSKLVVDGAGEHVAGARVGDGPGQGDRLGPDDGQRRPVEVGAGAGQRVGMMVCR